MDCQRKSDNLKEKTFVGRIKNSTEKDFFRHLSLLRQEKKPNLELSLSPCQQRDRQQRVQREIFKLACENLIAILISIIQKNLQQERNNSVVFEFMKKYLSLLPICLTQSEHISLLERYLENVSKKNAECLNPMLIIESLYKSDEYTSMILSFKKNFFPSLIGEEPTVYNEILFDIAVGVFQKRYLDYLLTQKEFEELKQDNFKTIENICLLAKECFSGSLRNNVKLIITELIAKRDYYQIKLEKKRKENKRNKTETLPKNESMAEEYSRLVIENHKLENELQELQIRKRLLATLNQEKVERLRRLVEDLEFAQRIYEDKDNLEVIMNDSSYDNSLSADLKNINNNGIGIFSPIENLSISNDENELKSLPNEDLNSSSADNEMVLLPVEDGSSYNISFSFDKDFS